MRPRIPKASAKKSNDYLIRFDLSHPRSPLAAAALAMILFSICIAQSDAQIAKSSVHRYSAASVIGVWRAPASMRSMASVQQLLHTTKLDDIGLDATRTAPMRVDVVVNERRIALPAPDDVSFSTHLRPGERRVTRAGRRGAAWLTERVTLWDDVVVDRTVVDRTVVEAATPAHVLEGAPRTLADLRRFTEYRNIVAGMDVVATAYTPYTATAYPTGYTATGVLARRGIVAVDPRVIPLGSVLFVPGYGVAVAADTGGAIVGNRIDLCMDSYGDAISFGRQTVHVYILKR
jgi:3D (Asp-Asp-Asp) domain-containing protein